jgi:tyramine---L-glutamate ligase
MKILIFEYITGGGMNQQPFPEDLLREGQLMLQALLDNFASVDVIELQVMLDSRLKGQINSHLHDVELIDASQNSEMEFVRLMQSCDAVWPIAPEFDDILYRLCQLVETNGKRLLNSPSHVVKTTGNKYQTFIYLQKYAIAAVPTCLLAAEETFTTYIPTIAASHYHTNDGQWIVKSLNGAGCKDSWVLADLNEASQIANKEHYIIQPHLRGAATSLSCLFKHGMAWIVSVNQQHFHFTDRRYHLSSIVVNHENDISRYQDLVDEVAYAFPALWGYVGIDLIVSPTQTWVLEINPRLTTAFVGIESALGINIADTVLQLLDGQPILKPQYNKAITLELTPHAAH